MKIVVAALVAALALASVAVAGDRPSLAKLENEIMCPVCGTTLAQSDSAAAQQIKRVIVQRIKAGDSEAQIKSLLVRQYGESILASPPAHGFNLLAWLLPLVGVLAGAGIVGVLAWRWSRGREEHEEPPPVWALNGRPLEPELERRLDEELARFD